LILDALDECVGEDTRSSNEIGKVLKTLNRLLDETLPIKIVVASRYENRIKHNFTGKHMIEISADDNSSDIEKMVVARIDDYNLTEPMVRINKDLEEKILKVFKEKSQGKYVISPFVKPNRGDAKRYRFQWATLHIDHLLDGLTDGILLGPLAVEETLGELPEGLIDTYSGIFHRINTKLHKRQKETAIRVFKWLLAMGTCDEKVLIAAICQRLQGQPGDYPNRVEGDEGYILTACQHLVTIQDSMFRFSHLSVQEYFETFEKDLVNTCHYDVAKVCASLLFRYRTGEGAMEPWAYSCHTIRLYPRRRIRVSPLARQQSFLDALWRFACNGWHTHFEKIPSPSHRKDIRTIVDESFPSAFTTWLTIRVTGLTKLNESSTTEHDHSYLGLKPLWEVSMSEQLWAESLPLLDGSDIELRVPVLIDTAFSCGVLNKLQRLVKNNMTRGLPLGGYEARREDMQRLLHQLFRPMVEGESTGAWGNRGMHRSTSRAELASELLDLGHMTNDQEGFLALCEAFIRWRQVATDDANLNTSTIASFGNLFSEAPQQDEHAKQCYGELARLILLCFSPIADEMVGNFLFAKFPHASTFQYQHLVPPVGFDMDLMLAQAATGRDSRYVDLLLSHGANANAVTEKGSPLMAALTNESLENAEVLLQAGADICGVNLNPTEGYGNITIMACSKKGPRLFQFLQKHNSIDMDSAAEDGTCLTPLIAACLYGNIDRVNVLLSMGVDFDRRVTTGLYANALCAAVEGQSMRAIRQLMRRSLSQPEEDALEIWRKKHLRGSTPRYHRSISESCQTLLSWLILVVLQRRYEERSRESDKGVTGCNEIEGGTHDPDDFLWDGNDDSSEGDVISEGESEGDGYGTTNHGGDERDRGGEPKRQQDEEWDHHRSDACSEGGTGSSAPTLRTAGCDAVAPGDDEVLKKINDQIAWLHKYCVQDPEAVRREIAETFGFSLSQQNDRMGVYLVRNALRKGFENVLSLTYRQCTLNDITKTWVRFLDLAEDAMGSVSVFENAFDTGDSVELDRLHKEVERLANGGV
jgi:hypothetical protein